MPTLEIVRSLVRVRDSEIVWVEGWTLCRRRSVFSAFSRDSLALAK